MQWLQLSAKDTGPDPRILSMRDNTKASGDLHPPDTSTSQSLPQRGTNVEERAWERGCRNMWWWICNKMFAFTKRSYIRDDAIRYILYTAIRPWVINITGIWLNTHVTRFVFSLQQTILAFLEMMVTTKDVRDKRQVIFTDEPCYGPWVMWCKCSIDLLIWLSLLHFA
jgi:hypothetical protein